MNGPTPRGSSEADRASDEGEELAHDRQVIAAATAGPWTARRVDDDLCMNARVIVRDGGTGALDDHQDNIAVVLLQNPRYADVEDGKWNENAAFITLARHRWPVVVERAVAMAARLDALDRENAALRSRLATMRPARDAGAHDETRMAEQKATNITWHAGAVPREAREKLLGQKGVTVWLTGLSAAGKSTIAVLLERMLLERGRLAYRLDGDNVRHGLNRNLGFSPEDRAENIRRIGEVAKLFVDAGVIVIASFISPYRRDRDAVRASLAAGEFVEVYVKVSVQAAARRDPKGLYKKALAGEIKGFTGVDDPYEEPESPEVVIDTETCTAEDGAARVLAYLRQNEHAGP